MPHQDNTNALSFRLESLEPRMMLAGDVAVIVTTAGDITLVGDSAANEFTLDADDGAGGTDLVITGVNGTTISFNGSTAASQTVSLDTASTIAGNLRIITKAGDDVITVQQVDLSKNLVIKTGKGNDEINLIDANLADSAKIISGAGDDNLTLNTVDLLGDLSIEAGANDDSLNLLNVSVAGQTKLASAGGSDVIAIDGSTFDKFFIAAGSGSDDLQITNSDIDGKSKISLGSSADTLSYGANVVFALNGMMSGGIGADSYTGYSSNFTMAPKWGSMETRVTVADAIADQAATEGTLFSFGVPTDGFVDASDTPTLTATLSDDSALPSWLSFDGTSFSGTPADGDVGTVSVKVTATDGGTVTVVDTFDIVVADINNAPTVANPLLNQLATESLLFSFSVPGNTFADADASDTLTLTATLADDSALPAWLSFDGTSFSGTPANGDTGIWSVKVTATDGGALAVSNTFDIVVIPIV